MLHFTIWLGHVSNKAMYYLILPIINISAPPSQNYPIAPLQTPFRVNARLLSSRLRNARFGRPSVDDGVHSSSRVRVINDVKMDLQIIQRRSFNEFVTCFVSIIIIAAFCLEK